MSQDSTPFAEMFHAAVNERMRAAGDDFNSAWAFCQMSHRGTYQAYCNEAEQRKTAKLAANAKATPPAAGGLIASANEREDRAAAVKGAVEAKIQETGMEYGAAFSEVQREMPELFDAMIQPARTRLIFYSI